MSNRIKELQIELESLGVEIDGRWGEKRLEKELALAKEQDENAPDVVDVEVTEEFLEQHPELVDTGVEIGEVIQMPSPDKKLSPNKKNVTILTNLKHNGESYKVGQVVKGLEHKTVKYLIRKGYAE